MTKVSKLTLPPLVIFTDGASSGNPGPSGFGAVIVWTGEGKVLELGRGFAQATNNEMELKGVVEALRVIQDDLRPTEIYTDSTYVIRGITQWIWAWRKRGWKTAEGGEVANTDIWKSLFALVAARGKDGPIVWSYVRGHKGVPGNERVDEIAVEFSKGRYPDLFRGSLLKYPVAILDLPEPEALPEMHSKDSKKKAAPYSYLSLVNGQLKRHTSWPECEAQVKGRPGAKFKKAMSAEEEEQICAEWGV